MAYEFLYQEELYTGTSATIILIDKPWATLSDDDRSLLTKILGAVKLSIDQVQIVHAEKTSLRDLAIYQPARVISFGVGVAEFQDLYSRHASGTTSVILSEPLSGLDDVKKKNLWAALRQMFP